MEHKKIEHVKVDTHLVERMDIVGVLLIYKFVEYTSKKACFKSPEMIGNKNFLYEMQRLGFWELLNSFFLNLPGNYASLKYQLFENVFIAPVRLNEMSLVEVPNNYIPDIQEYLNYNKQFIETFAVFEFNFEVAMKCLTNIIYRRTYGKKMGLSPQELDGIVFTWNRALKGRKSFVMNHPLKIEITKKILDSRPNSKAITFSATIKQAEQIGRGYLVHSGKTKKKNRLTMEDFSKLKTGVINTAKSLDEGSDIPGLNLAIILCNTSSATQKTQRVGRVIRYEEGKEAEIFTLVIKGTNEEGWYNTSSAGKNYIEISVSELDDILSGKETNYPEQVAKESDLLFRM